jgi:hypothetical protein
VVRAGVDDPEVELLRGLHAAGVRYLLIGRQACVQYGLPVMTFDYDLWADPDPGNLGALVRCAEAVELRPTVGLDDLAEVGVFALENDARVDVFKVKEFVASPAERCTFAEAWAERRELRDDAAGLVLALPKLEHLIVTKLCGRRKRDIEDVKALRVILEFERGGSG